MLKKVVFLSGTRADFSKIKSLIKVLTDSNKFEVYIFATGMHLMKKYGYTIHEIQKSGFKNIYPYINYDGETRMDRNLANTIKGFSMYIEELEPDMIVVHGDRAEALAGAIVGSLNNILVSHIEGGDLSGTIDESIRHSISKLSHIHFTSNKEATTRLMKMGETANSIFEIGSPDIDLMFSSSLPKLDDVKDYYNIPYDKFSLLLFHPVTTEVEFLQKQVKCLCDTLVKSGLNYVVIYPNNDLGSKIILKEYENLNTNEKFKIFPSIRFEYFLTLLKNADFIIGNSSSGIIEAPMYDTPTINLGTRQDGRCGGEIKSIKINENDILSAIQNSLSLKTKKPNIYFGSGNSDKKFIDILLQDSIWNISKQKKFMDFI